ncbi:MAG: EpsG family protein [Lachnospiraceae bacterium]
MSFWILNFGLLAFYAVVFKRRGKDNLFLLVALLHWGGIAAFRGLYVGSDTRYYAIAFRYLAEKGYIYRHAMSNSPVYIYYLKLFSRIIASPNGYMIATSVPTLVSIFYFIKRYSKNYYISVYLFLTSYFYFFSLNTGRQFLAIALTFIVFDLLMRKKYLLSVVVYFLAIGVHSATLVFGVIYIIHMIHWSLQKILLVLAAGVVGSSCIFVLSEFFAETFNYHWMISLNAIETIKSRGGTSTAYAFYCLLTICLMTYWNLRSQNKLFVSIGGREVLGIPQMDLTEVQFNYEVIVLLMIGMVIEFFFPTYILFSRVAYIVISYFIVLLANALENLKKFRILIKVIVLAPLFIMTLLLLAGNNSGVLNYTVYGG